MSDTKKRTEADVNGTTHQESKEDGTSSPAAVERKRPARSGSGRAVSQVFDTIDSAAAKLGMKPDALRARCRRHVLRVGDVAMVQLGGGITAFKLGKSWRVKIPASL